MNTDLFSSIFQTDQILFPTYLRREMIVRSPLILPTPSNLMPTVCIAGWGGVGGAGVLSLGMSLL